ncbi:hypothetical protein M427DRAFT_433002 [Gonapodya prolifera JEL478]|uniref:Uncharacterized protein n=1 Tax=Gonapodya prolifera (strain JEL478) TaxID=1344416 RepID=A0A139AT60_GONPJ|nr:hypothetical protein M427DRAFT_433002 [Gonapodya prolifera JEL478]|eukprot:KXS19908.1 hypothetical protein M427DRAFT_433002 [Gonapodya prolifera JEL478]
MGDLNVSDKCEVFNVTFFLLPSHITTLLLSKSVIGTVSGSSQPTKAEVIKSFSKSRHAPAVEADILRKTQADVQSIGQQEVSVAKSTESLGLHQTGGNDLNGQDQFDFRDEYDVGNQFHVPRNQNTENSQNLSYLPSPAPSNSSGSSVESGHASNSRQFQHTAQPLKKVSAPVASTEAVAKPHPSRPPKISRSLQSQPDNANGETVSAQTKQKTLKRGAPGALPGTPATPTAQIGAQVMKKARSSSNSTGATQQSNPQSLVKSQLQMVAPSHNGDGMMVPFQTQAAPTWGYQGGGPMMGYGAPAGLTSNVALAMAADIRNQEDRRREEEERMRREEELKEKSELHNVATRLRARIAHLELRLREAARSRDRTFREAALACAVADRQPLPPSKPGEGGVSEPVAAIKEETNERERLERASRSALAKLRPLQKQVEDARRMFGALESARQVAETIADRAKAAKERARSEEDGLGKECETLTHKCRVLTERLVKAKDVVETSRKRSHELDQSKAALQKQMVDLSGELEVTRRSLGDEQNRNAELTKELASVRSELSETTKKAAEAESQYEFEVQSKEDKIAQLNGQIGLLVSSIQDAESRIENLSTDLENMKRKDALEIRELSNETAKLRQEVQDLIKNAETADIKAKADLKAAEETIMELRGKHEDSSLALEAEHKMLEESNRTSDDLRRDLQMLRAEFENSKASLRKKDECIKKLEYALGQSEFGLNAKDGELNTLQSAFEQAEAALRINEVELEKAQVALAEALNVAKSMPTEEDTKKRFEDEFTTRYQKMSEFFEREKQSHIEEYKRLIDQLNADEEKRKETIAQIASEKRELESRLQKQNRELESHGSELRDKENMIQELHSTINHLKDVESALDAARTQANESQRDNGTLLENRARLEQDLAAQKGLNQELQTKLSSLEQLNALQSTIHRTPGSRSLVSLHPGSALDDPFAEAAATQTSSELIQGFGLAQAEPVDGVNIEGMHVITNLPVVVTPRPGRNTAARSQERLESAMDEIFPSQTHYSGSEAPRTRPNTQSSRIALPQNESQSKKFQSDPDKSPTGDVSGRTRGGLRRGQNLQKNQIALRRDNPLSIDPAGRATTKSQNRENAPREEDIEDSDHSAPATRIATRKGAAVSRTRIGSLYFKPTMSNPNVVDVFDTKSVSELLTAQNSW